MLITDLDQYKAGQVPVEHDYPPFVRTFYSPQDDVHAALRACIGAVKKSLVLAMYGYDDDELAEMIDHLLKDPTVYVQITLDSSQAGGVHERNLLEKYKHEMTGNSVAIGRSERGAIMHRKMAIVDGTYRLSGSTNWSTSGETLQDNELTVIQSTAACVEARHILDIEHNSVLRKQIARAAKP